MHNRRGPLRLRRPLLLRLALATGSLGALAWLLVAQHDQLFRAITGLGHAKPGLIAAAAWCEWASMVAFARMQRRVLRAGGQRLAITTAVGITFAGSALSVSVPIAGSGLGTAFTYRELRRREVSDAAAAFTLLVSGLLSALSLMAITATGALTYPGWNGSVGDRGQPGRGPAHRAPRGRLGRHHRRHRADRGRDRRLPSRPSTWRPRARRRLQDRLLGGKGAQEFRRRLLPSRGAVRARHRTTRMLNAGVFNTPASFQNSTT